MAYFTGTALNITDLIDRIGTHVSTITGWTVVTNGSSRTFQNDGFEGIMAPQSGGHFGQDGISMDVRSTATGSHTLGVADWATNDAQTINPIMGPIDPIGAAITSYHVFVNEVVPQVYVVCEHGTGLYRHMAFGIIDKVGSWTGGAFVLMASRGNPPYAFGSYEDQYDTFVGMRTTSSLQYGGALSYTDDTPALRWGRHAPLSSYSGDVRSFRTTGMAWPFNRSTTQLDPNIIEVEQPNASTSISPMFTPEIFLLRDGDFWSHAGYLSGMRFCNIRGYVPGQTITIDTDDWTFFPIFVKDEPDASNFAEPGWMAGFAYKQ